MDGGKEGKEREGNNATVNITIKHDGNEGWKEGRNRECKNVRLMKNEQRQGR